MKIIGEGWEEPFDECSLEAKALATMFYPSSQDVEKRQKLAAAYHTEELMIGARQADTGSTNLTLNDIALVSHSRAAHELGDDSEKLALQGFYAAHWLRYRLYASQEYPAIGSNNRWEFYVQFDLRHKLPERAGRNRNWCNDARAHNTPVAHLWAAWFDRRPGLRYYRPPSVNRGLGSGVEARDQYDFLGRAMGYFEAAREARLLSGRRGLPSLEDVWQLPVGTEAEPIRDLTAPDALVPDFDPAFLQGAYFPMRG